MNTREIALDVLLDVEKNHSLGSNLVKDVLEKYDYEDQRDKAFFKRLTEGVMERQITLDYVLDSFSKTPVKKMKPLIRCLLRMGAYQILYMESVPDSAACNEAVKLAKKRGFSSLSGFVNGVLRSVAKKKDSIPMPDEKQHPGEYLCIKYSTPGWLVDKWIEDYGYERTASILEGALQKRPVVLRFKEALCGVAAADGGGEAAGVNAQLSATCPSIETAVQAIADAGVAIRPQGLLPYAYAAEGAEGISSLPGYEEGLFWVQDVSSMLAVEAAGIRPGMHVLDICAAPGGKTMSAADKLCGGAGQAVGSAGLDGLSYDQRAGQTAAEDRIADSALVSCDLTDGKVDRIRENTERVGFDWVDCRVQDARQFDEALEGWADVVLADVPCSGLGVIGRKKEIRYRTAPEDLESLVALQKEILDNAWRYVKPGGILLYSTCTINPDENERMAEWIVQNYPFSLESLDQYLPEQLHDEQTKKGYRQLFLGEQDTDGFFMARLRREWT